MNSNSSNERLQTLMLRYLEGLATAEETRELSLVLRNSPEARREFARLSRQIVQLGALGQEEKVLPFPRSQSTRLVRLTTRWGLAAAACLAIAAIWFSISHAPGPDSTEEVADDFDQMADTNAVATLVSGADLVWGSGTNSELEVGESVDPGVLRLKSGVAQLEFFSGAQVILEGPAELDLVSDSEARLNFGKLRAHVPEQARGFKVRTPGVVVTDLGTEFALNQQPQRPPEVQVFIGKVELEFGNTNRPPLELMAGQGAQVKTNGLQKIAVNQAEFVGPEELQRRQASELKERYKQWKTNSPSLAADPAALVYFNFERGSQPNGKISNLAESKNAGTDGKIVGTKWVQGRWPGKRGLSFGDWSDSVRFNVPGRFKSLTYLAWVRLDGLPHPYNSLADTAWQKEGEPHWQITKTGELNFSIRGTNGNAVANVRNLIFSRKNFGRWMQVAAVYDGAGRSMSLYADGRLIARQEGINPQDLVLGVVELGNWPQKDNHRNFKGRIDEFALLSRALSAEEIQRLYDTGRPRARMVSK